VKTKKPIRPIWTTTVDPSEYDYVAQFTQTVKWANKNKELYPPTDVGKVWGLVQAYQRLERENAALRHSEESLASTVRGLEFELEKADAALDWLNTHCMSADPIMGRSTYRWTIEHDEPDIRAAIAKLRKAQV
jgi:hypothetical protein